MVQELLELKTKVDMIVSEALQGNDKFHSVVRDSFESVINRRQNKPAELIGTYQPETVDVAQQGHSLIKPSSNLECLYIITYQFCKLVHGMWVDHSSARIGREAINNLILSLC